MAFRRLLAAGSLALVQVDANGSSNVFAKAIDLLEKLKTEVETEGATEKSNYDSYLSFCTETEAAKEEAIKLSTDRKEEIEASIEQHKAKSDGAMSELQNAKARKEKLSEEKEASAKLCAQDKEQSEASDADMGAALVALESAIGKMAAAKVSGTPALLQFNTGVQKSLYLAEVLGLLNDPKRQAAANFLQARSTQALMTPDNDGIEYNKADYEFQSGDIMQTLESLKKGFEDERAKAREEASAIQKDCAESANSSASLISASDEAIHKLEADVAAFQGEAASAKESLLAMRKTLKDDTIYLAQLKENCEDRAADFKQRSQSRQDEIEAMSTALKVLKEANEDEDDVTKAKAPSFLQQSSLSRKSRDSGKRTEANVSIASVKADATEAGIQAGRAFRTRSLKAAARYHEALATEALKSLEKELGKHSSARLSGALQAAKRIVEQSSGDPLADVKKLIFDMVTKLEKEAAEEAGQEGYCNTAMAQANSERDRRKREAAKINVKMASLAAKQKELEAEIELAGSDMEKRKAELLEVTELRNNESVANLASIKEAKQSAQAVKQAIEALKAHYKSAARKATKYDAFLQQSSRLASEPDAGFEGSYGGKQQAASGIIGMLEVVQADCERSAEETKKSEEKAAEEFAELRADSKADIASQETSKALNEQDLEATLNALKSAKVELTSTMDLLDGALRTLEDLKPQCVDAHESYEERKARMEQEVADLKAAFCTLDPDDKEEMCQK